MTAIDAVDGSPPTRQPVGVGKKEESDGICGNNGIGLGEVGVQRRLTRGKLLGFFAKHPACLVGMEACAAAHHWGRELQKLGHAVRLMPPNYVKPYVKRQKNDAADAEAICEAVKAPQWHRRSCLLPPVRKSSRT